MTAVVEETGLAAQMRTGSQAEHTEAESSSFMDSMLKGEINELGYADYLAALRPIYAALEKVSAQLADHPVVGSIIDPGLDRLASIDADIAAWSRGDAPAFTSEAVANYVARIESTLDNPILFVAHHYTRYLGDLSGGQAIGKLLGRAFDITDGTGLTMYQFDAIEKPKPYKDGYRARLDELAVSDDERQQIVDEVRVAFGLNSAVFIELGKNLAQYQR